MNPDALILAEHYGDPQDWLQGDEWDSVMNYDAFMEPVTWFLTGMEKHSDERRTDLWGNADNFIGAMRHFMASMLTPSLQVAMNELSNHDHSRFLTRTNHKVGRVSQHGTKGAEEGVNLAVMREAVVMQMTWVVHRRFITEMKWDCVVLLTRITEGLIRGGTKIRSCLHFIKR